MVATPHFYPEYYENYADVQLEKRFNVLKDKLCQERIDVHLYKGMEILGTEHLCDDLQNKRVWTINDTKYFLVVFDFDEKPDYCTKILADTKEIGYIPVIAHPEWYYFVQDDPALVCEWFKSHCGIQVNKGSILGYFGKREQRTVGSAIILCRVWPVMPMG